MAQVEPVIYHELEGPTPVPEGWENRPKQIKVNTITTEMTFCHTSTHMLAFMYQSDYSCTLVHTPYCIDV